MTHNLTNDELIDQTAEYLRSIPYRSGVTSTDSRGRTEFNCSYKSLDTKAPACAAGLWITDEFYCTSLEGNDVESVGVTDALMESGITAAQVHLLGEFQCFHDREANWGHDGLTLAALVRLDDLVERLKNPKGDRVV